MERALKQFAGIAIVVVMACCLVSIGGILEKREAQAAPGDLRAGAGAAAADNLSGNQLSTEAAKNLLVNPGAEKGDLTGWVDSSDEKCWMVGYEGNIEGWEHPAPHKGKYYFMTGWPTSTTQKRYLYQDVNISSHRGKTLTFSVYLGGYGHADKGGIKLAILDKSGKVIGSKASKMYEVKWGDWSKHLSVSLDVPSNAYKARAYLVGELHEGSEADAYFDDASLVAEYKVGQVKNVKPVNKKGRYVYLSYSAVSGASGYQIKYSTNSSMSGAKTVNATTTKGYFLNKATKKKVVFSKGKKYYFKVRAYKKASSSTYYGKWSSKASVKITK